jgi:hypothetical protein
LLNQEGMFCPDCPSVQQLISWPVFADCMTLSGRLFGPQLATGTVVCPAFQQLIVLAPSSLPHHSVLARRSLIRWRTNVFVKTCLMCKKSTGLLENGTINCMSRRSSFNKSKKCQKSSIFSENKWVLGNMFKSECKTSIIALF